MQKKTLRRLKPFGAMHFGLMKPKLTNEVMFGEKRLKPDLANCEAWRWIHYTFSGWVAAGGIGNIVPVEGRMESNKYQEILEANVPRSVQTLNLKRGWLIPARQ